MVKIFFCCSWDPNPKHFLEDKYAPLTPNNSGKWNGLVAVTDVNDADWVIIIDDIHNSQRQLIARFNPTNVICLPREPARAHPSYLNYNFKYKMTYENCFHCWTSIMHIVKNYDELASIISSPPKNKLCSTITSRFNPGGGLYATRIDFIKKLSQQKQFVNKIDIAVFATL